MNELYEDNKETTYYTANAKPELIMFSKEGRPLKALIKYAED